MSDDELLLMAIDGELDEPAGAALGARLKRDPRVARALLGLARHEVLLAELLRGRAQGRSTRPPWRVVAAIAAGLLVVAGLLVAWRLTRVPTPQDVAVVPPPPVPPPPAVPIGPIVQQLVDSLPTVPADVRATLVRRADEAMPLLVLARGSVADPQRLDAYLDVLFEVKRARHAGEEASRIFARLDERVDVPERFGTMENEIRSLAKRLRVNVAFDAPIHRELVALQAASWRADTITLRGLIDGLGMVCRCEYDYRYGVVWVTRPERLWRMPLDPDLLLPDGNAWRAQPASAERDRLKEILEARVSVDLRDRPLRDAVALIEERGRLRVRSDSLTDEQRAARVSIDVADLELRHVVELLTLPLGLDARLERGELVLFARGTK